MSNSRCAVLALSRGGCLLGERLAATLDADFLPCKGQFQSTLTQAWASYDALVCIMAAGIVVRGLVPLIQNKRQDPAVVVCDERGSFAISLLSGHLGGANALALEVARINGGQAIITTASDVLEHTALDLWCRDLGLVVADTRALTRAMSKLVDNGSLKLASDLPLPPNYILPADLQLVGEWIEADLLISITSSTPVPCLLHPQVLYVGIGCNRGTTTAAIHEAVLTSCDQAGLAFASVAGLASIDLKADETGLLSFAKDQGLPLQFFPSAALNTVQEATASDVVLHHTGAKAVAEPAALLAAGPGARLLLRKVKFADVTVAIAVRAELFLTTMNKDKGR